MAGADRRNNTHMDVSYKESSNSAALKATEMMQKSYLKQEVCLE